MNEVKLVNMVTSGQSSVLLKGQLSYLKKKGYNVSLIASPTKHLEEYEKEEQINVIPIKMEREISIINDLRSLFRIIILFLKIRPDICNAGTPKAGLLGMLAAFITRVPLKIYTLRGLRYEGTSGIKKEVLIMTEKIACLCADKVICISPSLKSKAIKDNIVSRDKAIVIGSGSSNGLDIKHYEKTKNVEKQMNKIKKKLLLTSESFIIGYVGRMNKDKGLEELVESFTRLSDSYDNLKLIIIGPREENNQISEKIMDIIINNPNIIELGFVNDLIPYYYMMDILAFPTYREGFGNVSIEAQITETPVVTTNATGAKDTVMDNESGFIVPVGDAKELYRAIEKFIISKDLVEKMGKKGKERVIKEFRSEIIWDGLDKVYKSNIK